MKLIILVIENGITDINLFKKKFNPENSEIHYATSFLDVFDSIYAKKANLVLLSDFKGKSLTSEYIKTLTLANPEIKMLILSKIKIIREELKYYYMQRGADDIIEKNDIELLLNKIKYYNTLLSKNIMKYKWNNITKQIASFLEVNYNLSSNIKKLITEKFPFSLSWICHTFKKDTGITIRERFNEIKINKAKELLINTKLPVKKIYKEIGFETVQGFIKMFKKLTGVNPYQFKKKL